MDYDSLTLDEMLEVTDLSRLYNDDGCILDEVQEHSRFVTLDKFLEIGDDDYEKWGLE